MNTNIFLIIYGVSVIVSFILIIINYKDSHKRGIYRCDATIGHLLNAEKVLFIISLIPVINIIVLTLIIIEIIWDKLKNIKI